MCPTGNGETDLCISSMKKQDSPEAAAVPVAPDAPDASAPDSGAPAPAQVSVPAQAKRRPKHAGMAAAILAAVLAVCVLGMCLLAAPAASPRGASLADSLSDNWFWMTRNAAQPTVKPIADYSELSGALDAAAQTAAPREAPSDIYNFYAYYQKLLPQMLLSAEPPYPNAGVDLSSLYGPLQTDGTWLYTINAGELSIFNPADGPLSLQSRISVVPDGDYIDQWLVADNRLVVRAHAPSAGEISSTPTTAAVWIYDITDKTNPILAGTYAQSGNCLDMRVADNMLYLLMNFDVSAADRSDPSAYIPWRSVGGETLPVPPADIAVMPCPRKEQYITIAALDLTHPDKADIKAIFGAEGAYIGTDGVYLTACGGARTAFGATVYQTDILKLFMDGAGLSFGAVCRMPGYVGSGAMNEYNGNLRLITIIYHNRPKNNNAYIPANQELWILNNVMRPVGRLPLSTSAMDFSVRFEDGTAYYAPAWYIGYTGYTSGSPKPLEALNLANPTCPRVVKDAQLPSSFAARLTPFGDGLLLGENSDLGEYIPGGMYAVPTLLRMYRVTDSTHIEPLISSVTQTNSNGGCALIDADRRLIVLPVQEHYFIYTFENDQFVLRGDIPTTEIRPYPVIGRCVGDYLYLYIGASGSSIAPVPAHIATY
ncbi:MAG: beta-propeller domain-containing protein, partial [Oscillospiraceae bacterium]|nr:beta-propeller domain-containing protein [Oscillospiraceae bacterium]